MALLSSPILRLRALEPEDLDFLESVENDTDLWPMGVTNVPYSRYVLKRYIEETRYDLYADGQLRLVMELPLKGHSPVGLIDLVNFEPRHSRAEVGIVVLPEYREKGLATEAVRLLSVYSRTLFSIQNLYAVVVVDNVPALNLFRKAGFNVETPLPGWILRQNKRVNALLLQKMWAEKD